MVKFLRFLFVSAAVCALACEGSDFAERLYKEGQRAERAGDTLHAYLLYARAVSLDPANAAYATHKAALQGMAALSAHQELAPDLLTEPDPDADKPDPVNMRELLESRESLPPTRLAGSSGKKSFDLKGDARMIFEKVAEAYGLLVVFEADYQSPPQFTFRIEDVDFAEAFRALETVGNSFVVPVNSRLALVVRDTAQKRTERSPTMAVEIPIPERMSVQDAQEILTAVQQTLDIRRIVTDPTRHMIFMRDQASKIDTARQMFYNLSKLRPQIEIDVEFLSVDKNSSLQYGLSLPTQFSFTNLQGAVTLPTVLRTLERLTGASTPLGLAITNSSITAMMSRSSSNVLLNAQIVSLDGQAATLHVGNRYPIITNQYVGNTSGTGQVFTPPPTINYEDLGLVLKVTPSLHDGGEVTLDLDTEFKVLGAPTSVGIPIIGNRKYTGKVRLKDGEWAVVAGLVQENDSDVQSGFPGVSRIPFLGRLLSQNNIQKSSSEVLLVLKPHPMTLAPWDTVPKSIWIGTETRPLTFF
jgi:general secretion pathway protein D